MIAYAQIVGSKLAPNLKGKVLFKDLPNGTEICIEVTGLPQFSSQTSFQPQIGPHGFHIHEIGKCEISDEDDPFTSAESHFNPSNQPHGNHAGDLPTLFSNNGYARMCFYTSKFSVYDIIGRSIIIHQSPDDGRTQPTGNSGKRIGCGIIKVLQ